jgi:hypothetical protein
MAASAGRKRTRRRVFSAVVAAGALAGSAMLGCRDPAAPTGQRGSVEVEPRAGRYVVAEFDFWNACADPAFELSNQAATAHSATFDLRREADDLGSIVLTGALAIASPTPGDSDIVIFEGPDSGRYRIAGDTLRLWFPKQVNQWVGVLRFTRYQAGQLVGLSRSRCRSLALRLEKLP